MKDYEKGAIFIGIAALGFAAYQAFKTKQAADATDATDPSRNPIQTAIELGGNIIGGVSSWFRQRYDDATGYTKGKSEEVINTLWAAPSDILYQMGKAKDYGLQATEAGTKYIWGIGAGAASAGKEKLYQLTNKPFTAMGNAPAYIYNAAREVPKHGETIFNTLSGVGSKLEETTKKTGGTVKHYLGRLRDFGLSRRR